MTLNNLWRCFIFYKAAHQGAHALAWEQPVPAAGMSVWGDAETPEPVGLREGRTTGSLGRTRGSGPDWGSKPFWPPGQGDAEGPRICLQAWTHQRPEGKPGAFLPVHNTRSKKNICSHITNDHVETRVSEMLELEVIQHKLHCFHNFHWCLIQICWVDVKRSHQFSQLWLPEESHPFSITLAPCLGWLSSQCTLALLHWF